MIGDVLWLFLFASYFLGKRKPSSEESLHAVLKSFVPENQRFFMFVKDCLLSFVKKVGNKVAEERLNISSFVLDRIMQDKESSVVKKT